ncbi:MAG: FAD:protein FMN transferase [Rhodoglobus sp.]
MRHVFETMGTVASIELSDEFLSYIPELESVFRRIDERFSLYLPGSELSAIAAGRLDLSQSSARLRGSYERALLWRSATSGLFTPHRPDGVIDLNGIVKAEATEEAGEVLDSAGCESWAINVGGDILVRENGDEWPTGIADPDDAGALLGSVGLDGTRRALATSGSAQRGDHIWLGGSPGPAEFVQVSVIAGDIVTADVLATAIVAGGPDALDDLCDRWPIDVFAVDRSGTFRVTPGFRRSLGLAPVT